MAFTGVHKQLRQYTGEETGNLVLGQNGFDIITATEVEAGTTAGYENVKYWMAIKAISDDSAAAGSSQATVTVEARSVVGDSLSDDGAYDSSSPIELPVGDVVYGVFDKIDVGTDDHIIAYRG